MTLGEMMVEVWRQSLVEDRGEVDIAEQKFPVTRTRSKGLRVVAFQDGAQHFEGIEQNPETRSRWAAMARSGSRIMQFSCRGRYIGNVCDGTLTRYPSWKAVGLDE
jgi:hypothetical protein